MKRSELESMTVKELAVLAREANIAGRSKMKKADLVNALAEDETPATEPEQLEAPPEVIHIDVDRDTVPGDEVLKMIGSEDEDNGGAIPHPKSGSSERKKRIAAKPDKVRCKRKRNKQKDRNRRKMAKASRKKNRKAA